MKNKDVLCVGLATWEGDYAKTIVEVMTVISDNNRVLYVDYQYTFKDAIMSFFGSKYVPFKRALGLDNRLRKITTKRGGVVNVLTPFFVIPNNFLPNGFIYETIRQINAWIVYKSIDSAFKKLQFNNVIGVNAFNPFIGVSMLNWKELSSLIYYCYDDIGAAVWAQKHGKRLEEEFVLKADAVISTSEALHVKNLKINPKSYLIKNGVDYELFSKGYVNVNKKGSKKIVGYIGSVDDRLDYDLLEYLFKAFTDVDFYFIGRADYLHGKNILFKYSNVKVLGAKPVYDLPKYIQLFHAGIIPFVDNEFTKSVYPLKINEYLAAGLPVVLTSFGSMQKDFNEISDICSSHEEFKYKLGTALIETTNDNYIENMKVAKANSWENRVDAMYNAISGFVKA